MALPLATLVAVVFGDDERGTNETADAEKIVGGESESESAADGRGGLDRLGEPDLAVLDVTALATTTKRVTTDASPLLVVNRRRSIADRSRCSRSGGLCNCRSDLGHRRGGGRGNGRDLFRLARWQLSIGSSSLGARGGGTGGRRGGDDRRHGEKWIGVIGEVVETVNVGHIANVIVVIVNIVIVVVVVVGGGGVVAAQRVVVRVMHRMVVMVLVVMVMRLRHRMVQLVRRRRWRRLLRKVRWNAASVSERERVRGET